MAAVAGFPPPRPEEQTRQTMGRACSICTHRDRLRIEAELGAGFSLRRVAATYNVNAKALHRHRQNAHQGQPARVPAPLLPVRTHPRAAPPDTPHLDPMEPAEPAEVLAQLELDLRGRLAAALEARDDKTSTSLVKPLLDVIDRRQRLAPSRSVAVDLTRSPQYLRLRAVLVDALRPYPDAAVAVATALAELED